MASAILFAAGLMVGQSYCRFQGGVFSADAREFVGMNEVPERSNTRARPAEAPAEVPEVAVTPELTELEPPEPPEEQEQEPEPEPEQEPVFAFHWPDSSRLRRWLIEHEFQYSGGEAINVPCKREKLNAKDKLLCKGSDRMGGIDSKHKTRHNYGYCYATWLDALRSKVPAASRSNPPLVAEVGILKGSGLAMWSTLFTSVVQIHGFDLDLSNTRNNMPFMKEKGAFPNENFKLHTMNQVHDNAALIGAVADGKKFFFVVDDGMHTRETIAKGFETFKPYLASEFLYVVEDAKTDRMASLTKRLDDEFELHHCESDQELWAITRKAAA